MLKVVYNASYGGFNLSHEDTIRYAELAGKKLTWEIDESGYLYHLDDQPFSAWGIPRHDPALVQVVEEPGDHGSQVHTLTGNRYRIHEYDGMETVIEPEDEDYITITSGNVTEGTPRLYRGTDR